MTNRVERSINDSLARTVGAKAPAWCDYAANKVPWAHRFVKHIETPDISDDLKQRVRGLIDFLRRRTSPAAVTGS